MTPLPPPSPRRPSAAAATASAASSAPEAQGPTRPTHGAVPPVADGPGAALLTPAAAPLYLGNDATADEGLAGYIAYLGGSFDPGHYGHVAGGVALLRRGAEALWLAPTHVHADKRNSCPFRLRLVQCQAVADEIDRRLPKHLRGRVHVTDVEARVDSGGQTSRLFAHLTAAHPAYKFAFAMGSDCLEKAPGWEGWDALQRMVRVVVFDRPGYPGAHQDLLGDPMPEVSSTAIRRALGAGTPPAALGALMPPAIAALVDSCNLYGAMRRADLAPATDGAAPDVAAGTATPRDPAAGRAGVAATSAGASATPGGPPDLTSPTGRRPS